MECLHLCLRRSSTPCRVPEAQQLSDEDAQVRTAFAIALAGLARPLAAHAEQQGWALPGGKAAPAGALPEDLQLRGLLPLEAAHSRLDMKDSAAPQVRLLSDCPGLSAAHRRFHTAEGHPGCCTSNEKIYCLEYTGRL